MKWQNVFVGTMAVLQKKRVLGAVLLLALTAAELLDPGAVNRLCGSFSNNLQAVLP